MTASEVIESTQNPLIKRIRSIKTRKGRKKDRTFWVEGLAPTLEALQAGWDIEVIVRCPEVFRSEEASRLISETEPRIRDVTKNVFESISDRDGPTGLGAIVRVRDLGLGALEIQSGSLLTVLVEPQDPGNLGSILRTTYSAGGSGVVLVGQSTDPYDPRAVRASMGAIFRVPVVRELRVDAFVEWVSASDVSLVGTSSRGNANHRGYDYPSPMGLVMGNEQKGIPVELIEACEVLVKIPMAGTLRSLNLSAATAVVLYEAAHQIGLHDPPTGTS